MTTVCNYGSISLGSKGNLLDKQEWERRCAAAGIRVVPFGKRMTSQELKAVGFRSAAVSRDIYEWES